MADQPRSERWISWWAGLLVIIVLAQVCGFIVGLPVLFVLSAMGAPPRVLEVAGWLIRAGSVVAAILSWRAMQKASRDEERRHS
jgi:membrane protein implicated in regulation of membrane protease activity